MTAFCCLWFGTTRGCCNLFQLNVVLVIVLFNVPEISHACYCRWTDTKSSWTGNKILNDASFQNLSNFISEILDPILIPTLIPKKHPVNVASETNKTYQIILLSLVPAIYMEYSINLWSARMELEVFSTSIIVHRQHKHHNIHSDDHFSLSQTGGNPYI
jgi:hypothetical protein